MCCAKTAEPIKTLFWVRIRVDPRNHELDGGVHRRHLGIRLNDSCTAAMCRYVTLP